MQDIRRINKISRSIKDELNKNNLDYKSKKASSGEKGSKQYYVNREDFKRDLRNYYEFLDNGNLKNTRLRDNLLICVLEHVNKMIGGMAIKSNFSNYTYLDDMKIYAYERCLKAIDRKNFKFVNKKFSVTKNVRLYNRKHEMTKEMTKEIEDIMSDKNIVKTYDGDYVTYIKETVEETNPYNYFYSIVNNSFIEQINIENKALKIKMTMVKNELSHKDITTKDFQSWKDDDTFKFN